MATVRNIVLMVLVAVITLTSFSSWQNKAASTEAVGGFALIELFTSEGCSSCPPADALVAKIHQENAGKPIYILAYHVDYWNRLGWKDPYSNAEYSKRQNRYSEWLHLQGVYTPQIVVNGRTEFVGSDENKLRRAISTYLAEPAPVLNLHIRDMNAQQATVEYSLKNSANNGLYIAVVQRKTLTKVTRGENGGRTLSHINVVRSLQQIRVGAEESARITLPDEYDQKNWDIIGFVQNTATGEILSATKANIGTSANLDRATL